VPNPARFARLAAPGALALDELGNLYVADRGNQRVRMIPRADGTFFNWRRPFDDKGDGVPSRFGDITPMKAGCIYTIAGNPAWDPDRTPIQATGHWFGDFGGDGGPAQLARLDEPAALAFADGQLYVADRENQRVRRISRQTGVIETVAGLPAGPQHATLAQHQGKPTDFEFPVGDGGDGGPGAAARLAYPSGLAVDATRKLLYIADQGNGRIRALALEGLGIASRAGRPHDALGAADRVDHDRDGEAEAYVDLFETRGLAVDANGNVLLADGRHRRLRKLWLQWD
jgi:DNA-binding beta-propeller fold protein YncE